MHVAVDIGIQTNTLRIYTYLYTYRGVHVCVYKSVNENYTDYSSIYTRQPTPIRFLIDFYRLQIIATISKQIVQ